MFQCFVSLLAAQVSFLLIALFQVRTLSHISTYLLPVKSLQKYRPLTPRLYVVFCDMQLRPHYQSTSSGAWTITHMITSASYHVHRLHRIYAPLSLCDLVTTSWVLGLYLPYMEGDRLHTCSLLCSVLLILQGATSSSRGIVLFGYHIFRSAPQDEV